MLAGLYGVVKKVLLEVSSSQDQEKSHPSHVFAVADSQKDQMFCKEVFRVEHKGCCQSGKHCLEIVVWSC